MTSPATGAPRPPERVTLVLGSSAGGTGAHVRMLAAGLAGQGITVTVAGPAAAGARFAFSSLGTVSTGAVSFVAVEIGDRPRAGDLAVLARLGRLLGDWSDGSRRSAHPRLPIIRVPFTPRVSFTPRAPHAPHAPSTPRAPSASRVPSTSRAPRTPHTLRVPHVVHAHGMRAGALAALALVLPGAPGRPRPALVVTVHNAPPAGRAASAVYRLLERVVARRADQVLCVSADLEQRMARAGARQVGRAVIAAPAPGSSPAPSGRPSGATPPSPPGVPAGQPPPARPDGWPPGRPVVLAAGRLAAQKGFGTLIDAAARWRDLDPRPVLVIAGDGPLAAGLRARAAARGVDAIFAGYAADVPALLAAAAVFVLPSRWEGQPLVLQEALRAGRPVVATRVGGVPALTGEDAAVLVPPDDPAALADAVRAVLGDAALSGRLSAAAGRRAAALPTADGAVAAALSAYALSAYPGPAYPGPAYPGPG